MPFDILYARKRMLVASELSKQSLFFPELTGGLENVEKHGLVGFPHHFGVRANALDLAQQVKGSRVAGI
jgi:hypothetical protein